MLEMEDGDGEEAGFQGDGNGDIDYQQSTFVITLASSSRMSGDIIESSGSSHSPRSSSMQGSAQSFVSPNL